MSDKDSISKDYEWYQSSFCASGACVEVAVSEFGDVLVSDSKLGDASPFRGFSSGAWARVLEDIRDGCLPDGVTLPTYGTVAWGVLEFTNEEWDAFVAGVKNGEFEIERLSSGDEAGSGFRGVARSGQAATGAGAIAVPPVPVAADPTIGEALCADGIHEADGPCCSTGAADRQIATIKAHFTRRIDTLLARAERAERERDPVYILDKDAVLELVGRYAEACVEAATTGSPKGRENAREQIRDLWDAIRGALTPVPAVVPEPAWGSGPLVEHNPETGRPDGMTEVEYSAAMADEDRAAADLEGGAR